MLEEGNSKKACFINPPGGFSKAFPLGFSQIISIAKSHGFEVKLIDLNFSKNSEELIEKTVLAVVDFEPEMLCLTGYSNHMLFIKEITSRVKKKLSQTLIVGGGYWCRWSAGFALEHTDCDLVVAGEGDVPFRELCNSFPDLDRVDQVRGISRKKEGKIISNDLGNLMPSENLDYLPKPEYELFNFKENYISRESKGDICCSMQTGRGCIGRCLFCTGARQEFKKYSHQRIIEEMKHLKETYGVNKIYFKESLTVVNDKWSREFLRKLIDADLGIKFQAICRIDSVNEEVIELLKKAGCFIIQFGFETADDYMLRKVMHKEVTAQQMKKAITLCYKAGIFPVGAFLIGLPGESIRSLLKTALFLITTRITATGVFFPVPFPGTELYEIAKKDFGLSDEKILLNERMCGYGIFNSGYKDKLKYLEEFKFCTLPSHLLIIFHKIFNNLLGINVSIFHEGYAKTIKKWTIKIFRKSFFGIKRLTRLAFSVPSE